MLTACWSPKGGCGTTVVSCALAVVAARSGANPDGALLVDLSGDVGAALGLPAPVGPGVADWLDAGEGVGTDSLVPMEVDAGGGLSVLSWCGAIPPRPGGSRSHRRHAERAEDLASVLAAGGRPAVVDCGRATSGPGLAVASAADRSLMVLRPCYLAMRRALSAPIRPSGVVLVREPERALEAGDVEDVLGVPVLAELNLDPAVARAVDAGLLAHRLPRGMARALRRVG